MSTWEPKAREMLAAGYTYAQIAAAVGRTTSRVHFVLNNKTYVRKSRVDVPDSDLTKKRRLTRRWCRRHAARLGETVEALYEKYGVADLDRTALWEERYAK